MKISFLGGHLPEVLSFIFYKFPTGGKLFIIPQSFHPFPLPCNIPQYASERQRFFREDLQNRSFVDSCVKRWGAVEKGGAEPVDEELPTSPRLQSPPRKLLIVLVGLPG